jgi:hypothetical protein
MKPFLPLLTLALVVPCSAEPTARLGKAADLSLSAASSGGLESARSLSGFAFQGGLGSSAAAVDASGLSGSKTTPALTSAPAKTKAVVPAAYSAAGSKRRDGDGTGFFIAGLAAPIVGAVAGALLGGGVGAVAGVLIGAGVGFVLLMMGLVRAFKRIWGS